MTTNADLAAALSALTAQIAGMREMAVERELNRKDAAVSLDVRLSRMEGELDNINALKNRGMGWIAAISVALVLIGGALSAWVNTIVGRHA